MTGFGVAAAAIIGLLVVLSGNFSAASSQSSGLVVDGGEGDVLPISPAGEVYQLIAVKIHADPCQRCKKIEPVFAGLQKQFVEKPVLFMTFDHTSKQSKRQAELLSQRLGIEDLFKEQRYTGVIVLATPEGEVREVVRSNDVSAASALVERSLNTVL